jgi:hypothetical protein
LAVLLVLLLINDQICEMAKLLGRQEPVRQVFFAMRKKFMLRLNVFVVKKL